MNSGWFCSASRRRELENLITLTVFVGKFRKKSDSLFLCTFFFVLFFMQSFTYVTIYKKSTKHTRRILRGLSACCRYISVLFQRFDDEVEGAVSKVHTVLFQWQCAPAVRATHTLLDTVEGEFGVLALRHLW